MQPFVIIIYHCLTTRAWIQRRSFTMKWNASCLAKMQIILSKQSIAESQASDMKIRYIFSPTNIQLITEIKENRAGRDITRSVSPSSFHKAKINCSKKKKKKKNLKTGLHFTMQVAFTAFNAVVAKKRIRTDWIHISNQIKINSPCLKIVCKILQITAVK